MSVPLSFSGSAQTTYLSVPITDPGATTFTVVSASTWVETVGSHIGSPLGTSGPFVITLDYGLGTEEKVLCTAVNASTGVVTGVTRGYDGTTASTHSAAASSPVVHTYSADTPFEASSAYVKTTDITNGTSGAVPVSTLGSGALPSGVTVPTARISSGALPSGVTLPATQVTTGALPSGVTLPAAQVTTGTLPSGVSASKVFSGSTSVTGITGYNNYMIVATAAYNAATALDQITQTLTVNGVTGRGQSTAIVNVSSQQPNIISLTSTYAYATTAGTTFTVSLAFTSNGGTATQSLQNIQIIGFN